MDKEPVVSIIIPFYNRLAMTVDCVKSIAAHTPVLTGDGRPWYEIILVDDASDTDDILHLFGRVAPVTLIRNHRNLGFAKSCNRGAAAARGKYLLFLNNDTIALDNWFTSLVHAMETEPETGIAGSKLLYSDGTVQHAGVVFNEEGMPFHIYQGYPSSFHGVNKYREFQAVTGACFIIDTGLFRRLSGFDERYLNGLEDIDLCLRVRQAGRKVYYCPQSCLYHLDSQTRKIDLTTQRGNIVLFKNIWGGKVEPDHRFYYQEDFSIIENLPGEFKEIRKLKELEAPPLTAIWGAGAEGRNAVERLRWSGIEPDFFVDNDKKKRGIMFEGYPVKGPEDIIDYLKNGWKVYVLIASMWRKEIEKQLADMGLKKGEFFWTG